MSAYPFNKKDQSVQRLIDSGKLKPASTLPPPIPAPHIKAYCHQCERETGTVFKFVKAGIANACSGCGCFRKRKPYISKSEFKTLTPKMAKGEIDETGNP